MKKSIAISLIVVCGIILSSVAILAGISGPNMEYLDVCSIPTTSGKQSCMAAFDATDNEFKCGADEQIFIHGCQFWKSTDGNSKVCVANGVSGFWCNCFFTCYARPEVH